MLTEPVKTLMQLSVLQTKINKRIDLHLSIHGINYSEFMVMFHLSNAPDYCLRRIELADLTALTASGVTRLLVPMEKIGLVDKERNLRDARVSLVKLTRAGKTLFKHAASTLEQAAERQTQNLSEKDLKKLAQLLALMD
ncbi:MAG: MarR family transcriptional regulator [Gammaproteobacteria bacterium]|nr:MarR family transcriptional regulator [Gammaproteobacteria bacterium]MDH5730840.1 MarR family transcriptional regulator [Gammaproteobacteria bacterium]